MNWNVLKKEPKPVPSTPYTSQTWRPMRGSSEYTVNSVIVNNVSVMIARLIYNSPSLIKGGIQGEDCPIL